MLWAQLGVVPKVKPQAKPSAFLHTTNPWDTLSMREAVFWWGGGMLVGIPVSV